MVVSTSIGRVGTPVIVIRPPDHRNSVGSTFAATWPTSHDPGRVAENAFTAREYTPYPYHAVVTRPRTERPGKFDNGAGGWRAERARGPGAARL